MNKIFKNFTLLYVEDEDFIREQTRSLLNHFFDNIIVAKDGKEGFDLFMKNKIDLIITDINMPNLNGLEMLFQISKSISKEENKKLLKITLSAHSKDEFDPYLFNICDFYFQKPLNIIILIEEIKKQFNL